jgi:hypothetical protein
MVAYIQLVMKLQQVQFLEFNKLTAVDGIPVLRLRSVSGDNRT